MLIRHRANSAGKPRNAFLKFCHSFFREARPRPRRLQGGKHTFQSQYVGVNTSQSQNLNTEKLQRTRRAEEKTGRRKTKEKLLRGMTRI